MTESNPLLVVTMELETWTPYVLRESFTAIPVKLILPVDVAEITDEMAEIPVDPDPPVMYELPILVIGPLAVVMQL